MEPNAPEVTHSPRARSRAAGALPWAYGAFAFAYLADYVLTLQLAASGRGHELNPFAQAWNHGEAALLFVPKVAGLALTAAFAYHAPRHGWDRAALALLTFATIAFAIVDTHNFSLLGDDFP